MRMQKLLSLLATLFIVMNIGTANAQMQQASPVDNGKALVNPFMGWQLYYYSNVLDNYGSQLDPEDTVDEFPGIGVVFLRLPWSFIETEKGVFNWEIIDSPAQRWIEKGKQVALCISATENWTQQGTPQWVFDEGAKYYEVEGYKEVEYDDPIYQKAVDHFVKHLAARYDGNPRMAYIAIGHFGMWGEGHTEISTPIHGKKWGDKTKKKIIDIYRKHFKHTQLILSDDYAGHDNRVANAPITDYAFKKGISLWDCSILVQPRPRHWYHAEMAQQFWPSMPVVLEHEHYQGSILRGAWDKELLLQAVEDYHASYMSIHCWPRLVLEENRDIIERINRRMGYRIQLASAQWPKTIRRNEPFTIQSMWRNEGVAPCYMGGHPCFTIKNKKGGIVAVLVDDAFNVKDLSVDKPGKAAAMKQEKKFCVAQRFVNPKGNFGRVCPTGEFEIYFSVGSVDGTPEIALPYDGDDGHKRYLLGNITISE